MESNIYTKTCMWMLIVALCVSDRTSDNPNVLLRGKEQINNGSTSSGVHREEMGMDWWHTLQLWHVSVNFCKWKKADATIPFPWLPAKGKNQKNSKHPWLPEANDNTKSWQQKNTWGEGLQWQNFYVLLKMEDTQLCALANTCKTVH